VRFAVGRGGDAFEKRTETYLPSSMHSAVLKSRNNKTTTLHHRMIIGWCDSIWGFFARGSKELGPSCLVGIVAQVCSRVGAQATGSSKVILGCKTGLPGGILAVGGTASRIRVRSKSKIRRGVHIQRGANAQEERRGKKEPSWHCIFYRLLYVYSVL
jgi:hypothetical protein